MYTLKPRILVWVVLVICITKLDVLRAQDTARWTLLVLSKESNLPISKATVTINQYSYSANNEGKLYIKLPSHKDIYVAVSSIGYQPQHKHVSLRSNHQVDTIQLIPESFELNAVDVNNPFQRKKTLTLSKTLTEKDLEKHRGENLASMLQSVPGVTMLQTGSTIAKPMIDGLYGNRVLIMNNGVRQEGQQWGVEHAPEIDPFTANSITVIKGADAIRYGADALGGVILVNPSALPYGDLKLHGSANLNGASNGRQSSGSIMLNSSIRKIPNLAWRVQGSYNLGGNFNTPTYVLGNTGMNTANASAAIGYKTEKLGAEAYYSSYKTNLGVYSGSDFENIQDLYLRISGQAKPGNANFTYNIIAPRQRVQHQLLKFKAYYNLPDKSKIDVQYSLQNDHRQEYDNRLGGYDKIPVVDLVLLSQSLDGVWSKTIKNTWFSSVGVNVNSQTNKTQPNTFATPLIPNFSKNAVGVFGSERWEPSEKLNFELGLRYDYQRLNAIGQRTVWQYVNQAGQPVPFGLNDNIGDRLTKKVDNYGSDHTFQNFSFALGALWKMNQKWHFRSNIGLAWRPPQMSELYSYGLHAGTGSWEVGDSSLKSEQGYKWVNTLEKQGERFAFTASVYVQYIKNYIYLNPTGTFSKTFNGAFPVFQYLQTNATYNGLNFEGKYNFGDGGKQFQYGLNAMLIQAYNLSTKTYLPLIPSNRFTNSLQWNIADHKTLKHSYLQVAYQYVCKQTRYNPNTDFAPPPPAYGLWALNGGTDWVLRNNRKTLSVNFSVNNLLNSAYRDYTNRFRYFTDDIGRNIQLRFIFKF